MNTDTAVSDDIDLRDRDAVAAVLRTVPRRFVVGFAARCARRVQPELLIRLPWDDGFVLYHLADGLISIAEGYATGLVQWVESDPLLWERRAKLRYPADAPDSAYAAAYVAAYAAYADAAAYADVGAAGPVAATCAVAAAAKGRALPPAIHDFNAVRTLSRDNTEDFLDDRPVPDGFFGPLWPDGMPEEYRAALAKLVPEKSLTTAAEPDTLVVELSDEGKAALDDRRWVSRQLNLGTFDEFGGQYVAVVGKKVLGHDPDLLKLREVVTAETGIPVKRIVTRLVLRRRREPAHSAPTPDTTS